MGFEFVKYEECYGNIRKWERWFVRYKNDDYMLSFDYPVDKNKNMIPPKDPTERLEVNPVLVPLREEMPDIVVDIKKERSWPKDYLVIADDNLGLYEMLCFCKPEIGKIPTWRRAYQSIKQVDKIFRELFPGYCLIDDEHPIFE